MVLWAHLKKICRLLKLQVTLINHLGNWQGVQVSQLLRCYVVFSPSEEGTRAPVFGDVKHLLK